MTTANAPPSRFSDEEFDALLGLVLRIGVLIAAAVVLVGGAVYLVRHGQAVPDYRTFHGEPGELRSIAGILADIRTGSGRGIIQLGLLLLIATPIARVLFSVLGFARQRNGLYVAITLVVLALLAYSLLSG